MKKISLHICSLFIFFLATCYITYPLIFHMTTIVTGLSDELVITWIQNWVIHAIFTNPLHIFQADIYYPFHNSLAYSETFITTSILAIPFLLIFKEPIITFNITQFSSFMLLGFCTYLLTYFVTKNYWVSILSGILLIFSPVTLDKRIHVQILAIEWVSLAILFYLQFFQTLKTKFLLLSLLCFVLQTYDSFMPGYFILFGYFFFSLFFLLTHKKNFLKLLTFKHIFFLLVSFAIIIPITIPYFQVSKEFNYVRDIRDAIHLAMQPEDMVYTENFSRLRPLLMEIPVKQTSSYGELKPGFLGFVLSILTIGVFIFAWKKRKQVKMEWIFYSLFSTATSGLILSFGPVLHINRLTIHKPFPIILPYALFYYILPGFQGLRNAARWEMLFVLFIVVCSAIVLQRILIKYKSYTRFVIYTLLIFLTIFEFNFPMHFEKAPQLKNFPKEYQWLQSTPKDTKIIEMPIYNWSMLPYSYQEQVRGYYNISYFRTTMSGFTGFSPPPWQTLVTTILYDFPSDSDIKELKSLQINYILVHKNEFDLLHAKHFVVNRKSIANGQTIINTLQQNTQVKLVKVFGDTYIYEIL